MGKRHGLGGTCRDLAGRRGKARCPVARGDDAVDTSTIRRTQARPEIVRIRHPVQHQQERRTPQPIDQVEQIPLVEHGGWTHACHHALMHPALRRRIEFR